MSSFFRRPGDDSSDSSDEDQQTEVGAFEEDHSPVVDDTLELVSTESLSNDGNFSNGDSGAATQSTQPMRDLDRHRDMMLATLLEEWCKTQAVDLINKHRGNAGIAYNRQSPEVVQLARRLYADTGQALTMSGFVSTTAAGQDNALLRKQYLAGLTGLSIQSMDAHAIDGGSKRNSLSRGMNDNALALVRASRRGSEIVSVIDEPVDRLIMQSSRMAMSDPQSDMKLSISRSHYESSFQQLRLLGRGGFGRVYHAFNVFDGKEYAVKKIPLSPKLSQRYRESGHQELESILREVQALAELEHSNIVRYHATWIEEPKSINAALSLPVAVRPQPNTGNRSSTQRFLDLKPHQSPPSDEEGHPMKRKSQEETSDLVFASHSRPSSSDAKSTDLWSQSEHQRDSSPVRTADIFTDGDRQQHTDSTKSSIDSAVYVLHVQMSLYPMTLAQYLSNGPTGPNASSATPKRRHCFHLVPSLKILLGILCGLQYIHAKGLVHRDIKPGNIFLSTLTGGDLIPDGFWDVGSCRSCREASSLYVNPRIGDFGLVAGLAHSTSVDHTPAGTRPVGTEFYRPPLWVDVDGRKSRHVSDKLDVFALGVVLVEMLWICGTRSERMHVLKGLQNGELPEGLRGAIDLEHAGGEIGARVEDCIRGMIEQNPEHRWCCTKVAKEIEIIIEMCK